MTRVWISVEHAKQVVISTECTAKKQGLHIVHEYDSGMWHRLVVNGAVGTWSNYADIAQFTVGVYKLCATTEYWWPELPEVFELTVVKDHELPLMGDPYNGEQKSD